MINITNRVKAIIEKLNIYSPPVPVERVAELFSLKIVYYSKFPDSVSGAIIQEEGLNAIGVNSNHPKVRQRFTIAHELGHYIMGHDDTRIIDDTFDKPTNKEQEANKFAAELLMPRNMLKRDIEEKEYDIPMLAKRYEVSEQAISVRLLETALINNIKSQKI